MTEALEEMYTEEEGPSSIHELEPKMYLEGTVTRTELFGAFVDIGVGTDGLVHISQLSEKRVNRVDNVVQEGDQVKVWVRSINPSKGRIELTMIEPPAVDWNELRAGQVYTGTVKKIERYGAFVDIGATRDGLVHISEITTDYIKDPKNYVNVGDEVAVKVLKVDRKRRRIELSMKALEEHMIEEAQEEDLDDLATEMELAFRQAQESRKRREQRRRKAKARADRDEIFSRTLDLREDQE